MSSVVDPQSLTGDFVVLRIKLDAEIAPVELVSGNQRGTGAAERIEYQTTFAGETLDQWQECGDRLLSRMKSVARVWHLDDVGDGSLWHCRTSFGQQIRLLVLVT